MLGFPIRTPSDHSSVDNSPRTIAASHVLHRLLMPRHPPCALQHFNNKKTQTTKPDTKRCSHPLCNTQHTTTPQPTHNHHHTHHTGNALDGPGRGRPARETSTNNRMSSQDPTVCRTRSRFLALCSTQPHPHNIQRGVEITRRKPTTTCRGLPPHTGKLLRKEVIQPHLPVRLPCYDFVPIAGPTFDHSPPTSGLGHGLRVLPTFVT